MKPRMIPVSAEEAERMRNDISAPYPFKLPNGDWIADADQTRAWRASEPIP